MVSEYGLAKGSIVLFTAVSDDHKRAGVRELRRGIGVHKTEMVRDFAVTAGSGAARGLVGSARMVVRVGSLGVCAE